MNSTTGTGDATATLKEPTGQKIVINLMVSVYANQTLEVENVINAKWGFTISLIVKNVIVQKASSAILKVIVKNAISM